MEIEKDLLELKQRQLIEQEPPNRPTYSAWIIIITLGVFAGELLHTGAVALIADYHLKKAMIEAEAEFKKAQTETQAATKQMMLYQKEQTLKRNIELQRQRTAEREKLENAKRKNAENCKYWQAQYKKEKTDANKIMMNIECSR
jgi:hypothetical protein